MGRSGPRSELAGLLRRPVSDQEWELLVEDGFVEDVEIGAADATSLYARLRRIADVVDSGRANSPPRAPVGNLELSDRDVPSSRYDLARSIVVAAWARDDPDVVAFRSEVLGGELVGWSDVPKWIEANHAGRAQVFEVTVLSEESPVTQPWRPERDELHVRSVSAQMLRFTTREDGRVRSVPVPVHFGPLQRLYRLSVELSTFYGWSEDAATVFVLADVIPWIAPVRVTTTAEPIRFGHALEWTRRIVLELDPSTPPAEVADLYQNARVKAGYSRRRRLSNKHAELAAFRIMRSQETWSDTLAAWNEKFPKWSYRAGQESNFRRDTRRAQARILYPDRYHGNTPLRSPDLDHGVSRLAGGSIFDDQPEFSSSR